MNDEGLLLDGAGFLIRQSPHLAEFHLKLAPESPSEEDVSAMPLPSNSFIDTGNVLRTKTNSTAVTYIELAPGSWARLYGWEAWQEMYESRSIRSEDSLQQVFSDPAKEFAILLEHISSDPATRAEDGIGLLVEIHNDSENVLLCARRSLVGLKPMTREESACYTFARLRADDLRTNKDFLAVAARIPELGDNT